MKLSDLNSSQVENLVIFSYNNMNNYIVCNNNINIQGNRNTDLTGRFLVI